MSPELSNHHTSTHSTSTTISSVPLTKALHSDWKYTLFHFALVNGSAWPGAQPQLCLQWKMFRYSHFFFTSSNSEWQIGTQACRISCSLTWAERLNISSPASERWRQVITFFTSSVFACYTKRGGWYAFIQIMLGLSWWFVCTMAKCCTWQMFSVLLRCLSVHCASLD